MKRFTFLLVMAVAVCGMMSDALADDFGVLKLTTEPSEVTVYVDGTKKGTSTPISLKLNEGDHTIRIECSGYKTREFGMFVGSGTMINKDIKLIRPLRSSPITVSDDEALATFKLRKNEKDWMVPLEYVSNEFKDNGNGTITDQATGLMWQKSGTDKAIKKYEAAKDYIRELNRKGFAGYSDWRLPTVDELKTLLKPKEMNGDLYIDPIFDNKQRYCWTSDTRSSGGAWLVDFGYGNVTWGNGYYYVRAVRSRQ